MGNDTMRNRPEVPAEDPLAELARLMGQEDEFADLLRQSQPAPRPAAASPAPRAPQPARPAPPREPAEAGRPAPGSFAALAAEVYGEGVQRPPAPHSRPTLEDAAREANRGIVRTERSPESRTVEAPESRAADPRAPYVPPRPQPTEGPRRPAAPAPRPMPNERAGSASADAVSRALGQSFDPEEAVARPVSPRPEAPRPAAPRADVPRPAAHAADADSAASDDTRLPSWMARASASARAAAAGAPVPSAPTPAGPAPAAARAPMPTPGQPFDLDDDAYDYGRSSTEYEPGPDAYESYEIEEDQPERRGRRRLLLIGGALVVVIAAVAGSYAFLVSPKGPSGTAGQPPVIRAEQGPNKVVPNQPAKEQASGDGQKLIYDRVGGSATTGNEQVVSSEEQPVDVSQAAQPQPRVIQTAPSSTTPTNAAPASAEPKRVRTLTVRADGTIVEDDATPMPAATGSVQSSAQPTVSTPIPLNAGTGEPVSTNPTPLAATPSIVNNVPNPTSPARVATTTPPPAPAATPAPAAPATRTTAAPAASATPVPSGAYVVQIASVRSEAEAQSTWRAMQSKYAGLLSGQPFSVKRADLGDRGVYYRAQVGSFGSREDAVGLCEALRSQGGDCMVQRN